MKNVKTERVSKRYRRKGIKLKNVNVVFQPMIFFVINQYRKCVRIEICKAFDYVKKIWKFLDGQIHSLNSALTRRSN